MQVFFFVKKRIVNTVKRGHVLSDFRFTSKSVDIYVCLAHVTGLSADRKFSNAREYLCNRRTFCT